MFLEPSGPVMACNEISLPRTRKMTYSITAVNSLCNINFKDDRCLLFIFDPSNSNSGALLRQMRMFET
jgi:hypothetical protein